MKLAPLILTAALVAPPDVFAATSAYWRHEDPTPVGSIVPGGETGSDTVLDSSGNGNHMRTFRSTTAPFTAATYSSIVSPLALRSGLPNTKSLDFGPSPAIGTEDGGGLNDDNFTSAKPIHTQLFTEQTIELSFRMNAVTGYQAVFGKDGKPLGDDPPPEIDSPIPPFKVLIRGDSFPGPLDTPRPGTGAANQLFVEWIDGDGDIHYMASGETVVVDQWYHIAVTRTATDAELWLAGETGDYELKDAISGGDFAGLSGEIEVFEPLGYSIGRGMFNNGAADWADAIIDEVRISDTALTPDQFLFVTAPGGDADFDGDNDVDGNDLLILQRGLGAAGTGTPTTGDANSDGDIDGDDLGIFRDQFGGPPGITAVPEPASGGLCLVALAIIALTKRSCPQN